MKEKEHGEMKGIIEVTAEEMAQGSGGDITDMGKGNREYASDVFSLLMEDDGYRLDVYNALNGSSYQDPGMVQTILLKEGISLTVRNDASFLIDGQANFYEHQSTYSPNMPLRELIYYSRFLKVWLERTGVDLFSRKLVRIPTPHFVVFYNGMTERPERRASGEVGGFAGLHAFRGEGAYLSKGGGRFGKGD